MRAIKLAEYIIAYFDCKGELLTNKKLQKILYYLEAWFLVFFNKSLYEDKIEAWVYGPVIPDVYKTYKSFKYSPILIEYSEGETASKKLEKLTSELAFNKEEIKLINDVLEKYGSLSAFELERLSHSEEPWLMAREGLEPVEFCQNAISRDDMKKYFSSLVEE
jgi:uncharacterized phage-associated protein